MLVLRLPPLKHNILRDLYVAPTQLHPNSWAFIRAFLDCHGPLGLSSFNAFVLFDVYICSDKKYGLGVLPYFSLYMDSCKSFKARYACLIAKNSAAGKYLCMTCRFLGEEVVCLKFPLFWDKYHYNLFPYHFLISTNSLDVEDQETCGCRRSRDSWQEGAY